MDMSGHDQGMGSMGSMGSSGGMAMTFAAGLPAMPLWFDGWKPTSAGTTFAAALGLAALAALHRFLAVLSVQLFRVNAAYSATSASLFVPVAEKADDDSSAGAAPAAPRPPAVWATKGARAVLATVTTALGYFLMLAVMTYNAYFFVAIIIGTFVGEFAFGGYCAPVLGH